LKVIESIMYYFNIIYYDTKTYMYAIVSHMIYT